jgi:DNA-binding FadR family transcriptional regulator
MVQSGDLFVGRGQGAGPRHDALQQGPQFLDLVGAVEVGAGDRRPVARNHLDKALGLQLPQDLANHRAADAELVAKRPLDQPFAGLDHSYAELLEAWASGDPVEVMRAVTRFYEKLFAAAGKHIAWEIVQGLNVRINQLRSMTIASTNRREPAIAEMEEIMQAIRTRDADRAEAAARRHVEQAWAIARQSLRPEAS